MAIPIEKLIETYGYFALFVGTLLEGETIVVIAGFAARRGYLRLEFVVLVSFIGTLVIDQLFFFIGRLKGKSFLHRRLGWRPQIERANRLLTRYDTWLILGFRFIYGMRTVSPLVIGMSEVKTRRFVVLNIIAAMVWAIVIATSGYFFGAALETLLGNVKQYERHIILSLAILGILFWLIHLIKRKKGIG